MSVQSDSVITLQPVRGLQFHLECVLILLGMILASYVVLPSARVIKLKGIDNQRQINHC